MEKNHKSELGDFVPDRNGIGESGVSKMFYRGGGEDGHALGAD